MKRIACLLSLLVLGMVSINVSHGQAEEKGYCYIIAYSFRQKVAFVTPVFQQTVKGTSYSSTEFTADVAMIQKMESDFQKFLQNRKKIKSSDFTVSARAAYKSQTIADSHLEKEIKEFSSKGLSVQKVDEFEFKR